jgi:ElaB/YqjD/DUF883 family membrane-anchored ribosome-binding protein
MNTSSKPHTSGAAMAEQAREALADTARGAVDSATEAVGDAVDRGQAAIRQSSAAVGEMAKSASEQVTTFASELEAVMKRNPFGALAGAVLTGVLIGTFMRTRT